MTGGTALAVALSATAGLAGAVQIAVMGELGNRAGIFPAIALSGLLSGLLGIVVLYAAGSSFWGVRDAFLLLGLVIVTVSVPENTMVALPPNGQRRVPEATNGPANSGLSLTRTTTA